MIFLGLVLLISGYKVNNLLRTKGFNGLWDFTSTVVSNYYSSRNAAAETVSITIGDKDLKKLEKHRQQALERGVIINDIDGDYVPAELDYNGKKIKVKLRLKGHMTDHLQEDKWSFRIKVTEKDRAFMGMKRFSFQHPGTRGYIYEWIYHELMKREDVIALRYKFINILVNGRDWGIYAVEENFENELVDNNKRLKAPILRFNPDLYWAKRLDGLHGTAPVDEFASYYSANPEAYREDKVLEDSVQRKYYLKAIALIEGLRSRSITVDQAFDIPRLAKFHALIDLVGGIHSIDWSDIKYYYEPVAGKLEPVAYESFTELGSRDLSTQYKYVDLDSNGNYDDWHTMIFSNKIFFKEYMKQLERVTKKSYLDSFFNDANVELKKNLSIINKEFPYKKFDPEDYYKRQNQIAKILSPPKSIHAYLDAIFGDTITIQGGAIDALPVQLNSLSLNKRIYYPINEFILPSKQPNEFVKFKKYTFVNKENHKIYQKSADSVTVNYSFLGSSKTLESTVFPFPHTGYEFIEKDITKKEGNLRQFSFLKINNTSKVITIPTGNYIINSDIVIPAGYLLQCESGVKLDFRNGAGFVSYSAVDFNGTEDEMINMTSSDSSFQGISIIQSNERSVFRNVVFAKINQIKKDTWNRKAGVNFYESPVLFENCSFNDCHAENVLSFIRSKYTMKNCLLSGSRANGITGVFSEGTILSTAIEESDGAAINITTGTLTFNLLYINNCKRGLYAKEGAEIKGTGLRIKNCKVAIEGEDRSAIELNKGIRISDCEYGILTFKNKTGSGRPKVNISDITLNNVKDDYTCENKSEIRINGLSAGTVVSDVKALIKKKDNGEK